MTIRQAAIRAAQGAYSLWIQRAYIAPGSGFVCLAQGGYEFTDSRSGYVVIMRRNGAVDSTATKAANARKAEAQSIKVHVPANPELTRFFDNMEDARPYHSALFREGRFVLIDAVQAEAEAEAEVTPKGKRSVRLTVRGSLMGYVSGKFWVCFGERSNPQAEKDAQAWLQS